MPIEGAGFGILEAAMAAEDETIVDDRRVSGDFIKFDRDRVEGTGFALAVAIEADTQAAAIGIAQDQPILGIFAETLDDPDVNPIVKGCGGL